MKKILLSIALFIGIYAHSYAMWEPQDLRATWVNNSSIELDWSDVDRSEGYYIYYGTKSWSWEEMSYEVEWVDLIEESETVISNLQAETLYYIAVTSIDQFGTESDFSEELEFSTLAAWETQVTTTFRLDEIFVIDNTSLEFLFSKDISSAPWASREFIVETVKERKELALSISQVDESDARRLFVLLDEELQPETEYRAIVLDIQSAQGDSISSGIDAFSDFTTPKFDLVTGQDIDSNEPSEDLSAAWEDNSEESSDVGDSSTLENISTTSDDNGTSSSNENGENDQSPTSGVQATDGTSNAGSSLNSQQLASNTVSAASENTKLPQTGAEHILLAVVAFLLSAWVYGVIFRRK